MRSSRRTMPISDAVELNPRVKLERGQNYSFVEMAALVENVTRVKTNITKEYKGSGVKFCDGDTLFARITPCLENGKIAKYRGKPNEMAFGSTEFIIFRGRKDVTTNDYAHYLATDPNFIDFAISKMTGTSGRQRVPIGELDHYSLSVPSIAEQNRITKILGDLDDKIEILREMNRTLEEMARSIFKAWFVDFEPVHAKAAGATRFKGIPKDLFNMLPDSFEASGLGGIPKGWSVEPLDKIADFLNGYAMQKHRPKEGEASLPVIKISELRKGISAKTERASINVPDKFKLKDGDFIFSWSGSLLAKFWTDGPGALNQHLFKVTSDSYPMWLVANWIWEHLEKFQRIAASKATTMGHIKRNHLSEAHVVLPTDQSLPLMTKVLQPLYEKQLINSFEAISLASLRDTLLPKLISGELEIPSLKALGLEAGD